MTRHKGRKSRIHRPSSYVLMAIFYVVVLVYLAAVTCTVKGNIIGVDFGLDFMKIALVAPRKPLEIVPNTASKRKTETVVSFDRGELGLGGDAYAMITRKPGNVFSKLHALIGRHAGHPSVVSLIKSSGLPEVQFNTDRGGIDLVLNTKEGEDQKYAPEELVALLLVYAQDITRDYVGRNVKDIVLTAPIFWGALERQALLDAAHLAGLNPLAIVDETTAAAVQFALDSPAENDTNILFYNMGAGSVQVSIVTFGKKLSKKNNVGQLTVKGKAWDETLGGHWFDVALVDLLAESFNDESIFSNPRAMAKLRAHAGRIKQVLSANVEIPVTIEALHKDKDMVLTVTREMLLEVCRPLIERAILPVKEALVMANMTVADIHGVEVVGGGVRVPALQEALRSYLKNSIVELGKEPEYSGENQPEGGGSEEGEVKGMMELDIGVHLNGDEAMSLGAAFVGANSSRSFNVRQIGMVDITPFAVNATLFSLPEPEEPSMIRSILGSGRINKGDEGKEFFKAAPVIQSGDEIPFKKSFSFRHDRDLVVELKYVEGQAQLPPSARMPTEFGGTMMLASYHIIGIDDFAKNMAKEGHGTPKVYIRFSCSTTGIPQVASAEAHVEYKKNVTYTTSVVVPIEDSEEAGDEEEEENDEATEGSECNGTVKKNMGDEDLVNETDDVATGEVENGDNGTDDEVKGTTNGTEAANTTEATNFTFEKMKKPKTRTEFVTKTKLVNKVIKQPLNVTRTYKGMTLRPMTEDEKYKSREKVSAILEADSWRKAKEAAKNDLEAYILHVRGQVRDHEEQIAAVSTQEQRDYILTLSDELEEWLYEDGWDETTEVYKNKQEQLTLPAEAMFFRKSEAEVRPATVATTRVLIAKVLDKAESWVKTKPHITESERQDTIDKANKILVWLNENEANQSALECHEDPVFTSAQIAPKLVPLKNLVAKLATKPVPRPKKIRRTRNDTNATNGLFNETEQQENEGGDYDINEYDQDEQEPEVNDEGGSEEELQQPGNVEEDNEMNGHKETTAEEEDDDDIARRRNSLDEEEL